MFQENYCKQNRILRQINKVVVKKSIELFTELAENEEEYLKILQSTTVKCLN